MNFAESNGLARDAVAVRPLPELSSRPVWFGQPERPLFGWFHPAQGGSVRDGVVVMCNPYGYDVLTTHYAYRRLAEQLAASGIATLRFDYYGTGDSSGASSEPGEIEAWLDSIDAACAHARALNGGGSVTLFGLRMGGLLALAAAQRTPVDNLILFGPSPSGQAALRELRALRRLREPIRGPGGVFIKPTESENFGFFMDEATREDLTRIDPRNITTRPAGRALVIGRDDSRGSEAGLIEHLRTCGVEVSCSEAVGYSQVVADTPWSCETPQDAWNTVTSWLADTLAPAAAWRGAASARVAPLPVARMSGVREEFVQFAGLFGILTEPAQGGATEPLPAVLLISVGANHRIGSNRIHVRWARDWAALGFRVLRMDLSGVGDSPARPGKPDKDLYSDEHIRDVRLASDFLAERGSDQVVLAGLCSGAYLAYHGALEDRRVCGAILVNNQTFKWRKGDSLDPRANKVLKSTDFYWRRALSLDTWRRILRGQLQFRLLLTKLSLRLFKYVTANAQQRLIEFGILPESDEVARGFQSLCARPCQVLIVNSDNDNDSSAEVIKTHLGADLQKMRRATNFRVAMVEGADHVFTPRLSQDRLTEILTAHLVAHHQRPQGGLAHARHDAAVGGVASGGTAPMGGPVPNVASELASD